MPGGKGCLSLLPVASAQAQAASDANQAWLEDCCAHLLCVLALDRFADYGSDEVGITDAVQLLGLPDKASGWR